MPKVCFIVLMVEFLSIPARRWSIDRSTKATLYPEAERNSSVLSSNKYFLVLLLQTSDFRLQRHNIIYLNRIAEKVNRDLSAGLRSCR